jgi:hypothetical protein
MNEITIRLTDKEYDEYRIRMKKDMLEEEYVKWMFMLGEYCRGQRN